MTFKKKITDKNMIYGIQGQMSISNFEIIDNLIKDIKQNIDLKNKNFIWDFSDMPFIDSTGLSVIALTVANGIKNNKNVLIYNANEDIVNTIKSARMDKNVTYIDSLNLSDTKFDSLGRLNTAKQNN